MNVSKKLIALAAVAAAVSLGAFPASADSAVEKAPTRTVKVWDLDLASSRDRQTLEQRVQDAASDVCRDEVQRHRRNTRQPAPAGWYERCVSAAVDAAERELDGHRVAAATGGSRRLL